MGGTRGELVPARESAEREARVGISAEMTARQGRIRVEKRCSAAVEVGEAVRVGGK